MADNVGSIVYDARIDTKGMQADANKAENIAKGTSDGIGKSFGALKTVATVAAVAITAAATAFGFEAIKSASELQGMRASFESMTGSAENARKVLSDLNKFSFETAFSSADINKAAQLLLGAGLEVQNLGRYMKNIGDVAGATGADLGQLTLPLSQALARGKLQTQDYYQILNSGAGKLGQTLKQELADRGMGDFQKAMEDGLVTSDILFASIEKAAGAGGFAFNGAIKQAQTFDGRLSNMKESLLGVGLAVLGVNKATGEVDKNGLFARFSDGVKFIGDWVTANKEQIIGFFKSLGDGVALFGKAWNIMMDEMKPVIDYIKGNKQLWEVLKYSLIAIAVVIGVTIIAAAAVLITTLAIVGAVIQGLVWMVEKFIGAATWAGNAIAGFINMLIQMHNQARNTSSNVIGYFISMRSQILGALGDAGSLLFNAGANLIQGMINGLNSRAFGVFQTVADIASKVTDTVKKVLGIKSPSRVMMKMGDYLMQGLSIGIDRNAGLATGSASDASNGVISAFNSGIISPTISSSASGPSAGASGQGVTQNNYISKDIDLDAASRTLAYQMARG